MNVDVKDFYFELQHELYMTVTVIVCLAAPAESLLTITRPMQDVKVKAGEIALLECFIAGPQALDVDWLANGKLIQPALFDCKMQCDGHRCRLLFKSAHENDSGSYTCKLSTAKGRSRHSSKKKAN